MTLADWLQIAALVGVIASGAWAVTKWFNEQARQRQEKRFEQYWKLVDICQDSRFIAKQSVSIMLLARYPEYAEETLHFLADAKTRASEWSAQNNHAIEWTLKRLSTLSLA